MFFYGCLSSNIHTSQCLPADHLSDGPSSTTVARKGEQSKRLQKSSLLVNVERRASNFNNENLFSNSRVVTRDMTSGNPLNKNGNRINGKPLKKLGDLTNWLTNDSQLNKIKESINGNPLNKVGVWPVDWWMVTQKKELEIWQLDWTIMNWRNANQWERQKS